MKRGMAWLFCAVSLAAQPYLYVANTDGGTVSIVNAGPAASYETVATIPVEPFPVAIAVSPDGKRLYVASAQRLRSKRLYAASARRLGKLSVVDLSSRSVSAVINTGLEPFAVAVSPDGSRAYVSNSGSGSISVVDTAANAVIATIPARGGPRGLAVTPDGTRVYVANLLAGTVSVIDTAMSAEAAQIPVGKSPISVTIDPHGAFAYVANSESGTISVLDLAANQVKATLDSGRSPDGMVLSPDGSRLFVANSAANFVSVFDTASRALVARVPVNQPRAIAASPDGSRVFVTSTEDRQGTIIDAITNQAAGNFPTGLLPMGVALTPASAIPTGIAGQIVLGPNCPVFRVGDPNCADRPYQATIVVKNADQSQIVTQVQSDAAGQFRLALPPGQYWIVMPDAAPRFPFLKPMQVTVPSDQYVQVTVYYDTGIR